MERLCRIYSVSSETFCPVLACMFGMRITLPPSARICCVTGVASVEHKAGHAQAVDCRLDLSQATLNILMDTNDQGSSRQIIYKPSRLWTVNLK